MIYSLAAAPRITSEITMCWQWLCFENLVVMSTFEMARVNFEPALFVGCGAWHSLVVGISLSTCRTMISPWVSHLVLITTTGYFRGGLFVQLLRVGDTRRIDS